MLPFPAANGRLSLGNSAGREEEEEEEEGEEGEYLCYGVEIEHRQQHDLDLSADNPAHNKSSVYEACEKAFKNRMAYPPSKKPTTSAIFHLLPRSTFFTA